jgi:hypothetical protein
MVEIVQIVEHHSLAHARIDILVTSAKLMVNIIFKNVLDACFSFSHFLSGNNFVEFIFISYDAVIRCVQKNTSKVACAQK